MPKTGHFEARKPVQKHDDSYTIFARFFSFSLWGFSICYFFDLSLSQHYKQLLKIISVVFLQALRVFFRKILQKFGTILTTNYIGMYLNYYNFQQKLGSTHF